MRKSTAVISSVIISVCVLSLVVGIANVLSTDNSVMAIAMREGWVLPESLNLRVQGISENSGSSNVALSVINCSPYSVTLTKIQMEGTSVLTFINGTEIIDPNQMN